jgi:hypothetical protein
MTASSLQTIPASVYWLLLLFIAFYGASAMRYLRKAEWKRRSFQALGENLVFQYYRYQSDLENSGFALPPLLYPRGRRKPIPTFLTPRYQNILKGSKNGLDILLLELPYPREDGITETRALFGMKGANLPYFELVPLRLFNKFHRLLELDIKEMFSGPKVKSMEITGLGEFRRSRHHLWGETGQEERFKDLFPREFLEYLLRFPNWRIKGQGDWIIVFEENISVPPEQLREFFNRTFQSASLLFQPRVQQDNALTAPPTELAGLKR